MLYARKKPDHQYSFVNSRTAAIDFRGLLMLRKCLEYTSEAQSLIMEEDGVQDGGLKQGRYMRARLGRRDQS